MKNHHNNDKQRVINIDYPQSLIRIKYQYYLFIPLVILLLALVGVFLITKIQRSQRKTCDHCNILIVDIDTLRADELPCYGYKRNTTPNLCSFVKKSVTFTDNYSPSNWTLSSIFTTITSLYPTFHRVRNVFVDKLSPDIPTLAEVLQHNGYNTVLMGDQQGTWGLNQDNGGLRGYDQIITNEPISRVSQVISDLSKQNQPWFIHVYLSGLHMPYLLPEGVNPIENLPSPKGFPITQREFDSQLNTYVKNHYTEIFKDQAIEQYKSILLQPEKSNILPFLQLYNDICGVSLNIKYCLNSWMPIYQTYMQSVDTKNPADVAYVRLMYDSKLNLLDKELGTLYKTLDSKLPDNNTITVIMSDHGEAFGEHGSFVHDSTFHTEVFYTPLIIRSPNLPTMRVDRTTSNIDIFPTLLDLIGIKIPTMIQGKSLLTYVDHPNYDPQSFVMSETGLDILIQNREWLYFLPFGASTKEQSSLYHKNVDPQEQNNVENQFPNLTQALYNKAILLRSYDDMLSNTKQLPDPSIKIDPEKLKRMQKEGYF